MAKTDSPLPPPTDLAPPLPSEDISANGDGSAGAPIAVDELPGGAISAQAAIQQADDSTKAAPIETGKLSKGEEGIERTSSTERNVNVDRFGSDIQEAVKNNAWEKDKYQPERLPHRHFFDSMARRNGKPHMHLTFMAGHTHEFTYKTTPEGKLIPSSFKCGPALIERTTNDGQGKTLRSLSAAIVWVNPESQQRIIDTHTHKMTYRKTETLKIKI